MYFEKFNIKSEYSEIKKVREQVKKISLEHGFFDEFIESIELSIGELITNIIKHGQKNIKEKKEIEINIEYVDKELTMYFEYIGDIPTKDRIDEVNKIKEAENIMELSESGRGIYLMFNLMDEINYEKEENRAKIVMKKKLKKLKNIYS